MYACIAIDRGEESSRNNDTLGIEIFLFYLNSIQLFFRFKYLI